MMTSSYALFTLVVAVGLAGVVQGGPLQYQTDFVETSDCTGGACGEDPLILTPYLKNGQAQKARELAKVQGIGSMESYSGFFTVNESFDSNIFFWYFPAQNNNKDAPLLVWLQGGPGGSSMFAVFNEGKGGEKREETFSPITH